MELSNVISGVITTQNLNVATTATANSAVAIDCDSSSQMVGVQITGAYTSGSAGTLFGLQAQATIDGTNWVTLPALVRASRNELISNIPSAETGLFYVKNNSYKRVRICGIAGTATGSCVVTLCNSNAAYPAALSFGRKWYIHTSGNSIANRANLAIIRNSNTYPLRLENIEICGANNIWAAANTAQIDGITAQLYTALPTITGGSVVDSTLFLGSSNGYLANSVVQMITAFTSISGGTGFNLGSQVISAPSIGPVASLSNNSPIVNSPAFLKGLILPSGSALVILGVALGTVPNTPVYHVAATLTEVL